MPTRAPSPTPLPATLHLERLEPALLAGKLDEAHFAWEQAVAVAPESAAVQLAGARVALARGNLDAAENRAWEAVGAEPRNAIAWSLLGSVARRQGRAELAAQALSMAQTFDPTLSPELFAGRWQTARELGDVNTLTALAQYYIMEHPDSPLTLYYRAEALLADGHPQMALDLLLLRMDGSSPAILWYTLGRAYLAVGAREEAIVALEAALTSFDRGDDSLLLATDEPTYAVNRALGRAYLDLGHCREAKALLQLLATPYPELIPLVEEAEGCPEPTPTWTPWLPADWAVSPSNR
jgi:tetratricopeptide (TPR) repeat protein